MRTSLQNQWISLLCVFLGVILMIVGTLTVMDALARL